MEGERYGIGRLGRETGCKVPTIRYYEQIGLLPPAARTAGNHRVYGRRHRERLGFIRHCRELGFPLEAVRELLGMMDRPEQSCAAADALAQRQLVQVRSRIARLQAMEEELERMVEDCAGGKVCDCRIVEVLGDHALCLHDHHEAA